jgi:hypothetical protein
MIKTWQQRCEEHPDHEGIVTEQMIRDRMQEEIDELRSALQRSWEEWLSLYSERGASTPKKPDNWVGLTDEEIYDYADKFLYSHGSNYGIKSFGKAIEAKLKEKNNA